MSDHFALLDRARAAHAAGQHGEFDGRTALVEELVHAGDDECAAWALALRSQRWLAEPERAPFVSYEDLGRFVRASPAAREAAAVACRHVQTVAILFFARDALARLVELHDALTIEQRVATVALYATRARAWLAAFDGAPLDDAALDRLGADAQASGAAALVIETTVLRVLTALARGDHEAATQAARRASRMAAAEDMPQLQYLANVLLARMRRLSGKAHLATRILRSLYGVAPSTWRAWLAFELLLAGGIDDGLPTLDAPSTPGVPNVAERATRSLQGLVDAAIGGERAAFDARAADLRAFSNGYALYREELDALLSAVDPDAPLDQAPKAVTDWAFGRSPAPPAGLSGLSVRAGEALEEESAVAYVVAGTGRPPRRVLRIGLGLLRDETALTRLRQSRRKLGRVETALAALVLATPGDLPEDELFRAVYGFQYSPALHQGVLDVLLHRVRASAGDATTISRQGHRVAATLTGGIVVPDPRCAQPIEDRVLRLLSGREVRTAKDAATALGIPLRTAQTALQALTQDGSCVPEKKGRVVEYRVEDTTFSDPTRH